MSASRENGSITKTRLFKYIEDFTSKNWKFSDRKLWNFLISAQNIDCGYSLEPPQRGGSNKYPQSMVLSINKKNNIYSCKPMFYYIKVGFKWGGGGGQNYIGMFSWCLDFLPNQSSCAHVRPLTKATCLVLWLKFRLCPPLTWEKGKASGETARMRRFAWAFADCVCCNDFFAMLGPI